MAGLRGIPATLEKEYWNAKPPRQFDIVLDVVYNGLSLTENKKPYSSVRELIESIREKNMDDKIEFAADLLMDASEGYLPSGPKGPRPRLISGTNIAKLCGAQTQVEAYNYAEAIRNIYGSSREFLLMYSASNQKAHPDILFKPGDIKNGVVLPNKPEDCQTLMALLAADGGRSTYQVLLSGDQRDKEFYRENVCAIVEDTLNYPAVFQQDLRENSIINTHGEEYPCDDYEVPRVSINSTAFLKWTKKYFGKGKDLKSRVIEYFIPIKNKREFMFSYVAFAGKLGAKEAARPTLFILSKRLDLIDKLLRTENIPFRRSKGKLLDYIRMRTKYIGENLGRLAVYNPILVKEYYKLLDSKRQSIPLFT